MTYKQEEFLKLHVIEQVSLGEISKTLDVPRKELSKWYEELRTQREGIAKIRQLWTRKKIKGPFADFYSFYKSSERRCHYCGITEEEIAAMLEKKQLKTKRIETRGKTLELDRKKPDEKYDDLDNLVFCCYWCNNAKTDTFTHAEFLEVGKAIANIWKKRREK
jgi:predicted DNA-binding protein YlxM (UPF0122 family)